MSLSRRPRGIRRRHAYAEGRALIEELNALACTRPHVRASLAGA
jgi:hypothetical protein